MKIIALVFLFLGIFIPTTSGAKGLIFRGVNLTGAEFGQHHRLPGRYELEYIYPSVEDVALYANFGMNTIRLPFLWERLQPKLNKPFREEELERLDEVVEAASEKNLTIILDPHNYGKYFGQEIGSKLVPVKAYENFLFLLAEHYKNNPHVVFGLMNKPYKQSADEWALIAQAGVLAVRNAGAKQLILISGTFYSESRMWSRNKGGTSNSEAMKKVKDPLNNIAFEVFQYFDRKSSDASSFCEDENIGKKRLEKFTRWLREEGQRGFLSDFGSSKNETCLAALKNTLSFMEENDDVWLGWTYWAASSWYRGYIFSIYPPDPKKFPQADVLKEFLSFN